MDCKILTLGVSFILVFRQNLKTYQTPLNDIEMKKKSKCFDIAPSFDIANAYAKNRTE